MAPKQQFISSDIIEASFNVVRKHGWEGLTARAIAHELNSSTRPIYDHLKSMKNIEAEVVKKALAYFVDFISQERTGDKWLDQALGYVLFASREKHLFRCINDENHILLQKQYAKEHWKALGEKLSNDERFDGLPEKIKNRIRLVRWILVHGLAFLVNSGWYEFSESEDSIISEDIGIDLTDLLEKANHCLYEGFKQ
jgi:AcrR family transcriptional regulator